MMGQTIDLRYDLDATARACPTPRESKGNGADHTAATLEGADPRYIDDGGSFSLADCIRIIQSGADGMHDTLVSLCWHYASHDLPATEIVLTLQGIYHGARASEAHDERWQRDYADIQRTVDSAIEKVAAMRAARAKEEQARTSHDPWTTSSSEADPPDPLIAPTRPQAPYPVDSLPTGFADAVRAAARVTEADLSLAGTVTLSAVATAVGKIADGIEVEAGLAFPTALFTADIAGSSERKTSVERRVYAGIHAVINDELVPEYQLRLKEYNAALAVYERDKRAILSKRAHAKKKAKEDKGKEQSEEELQDFDTGDAGTDAYTALLGLHEPTPPQQPHIVTNDFTIEGIRDVLAGNSGQIAIVTSEGAALFNGYSFGDKVRRGASGGSLSRLWDGLDETVTRARGRVITIRDPRVSTSIGVQPRAAASFFNDLDLRDQGAVNRFLTTWPEPMAGTRQLDPPGQNDLEVLDRFNAQAQACLRHAYGLSTTSSGATPGQPQPCAALTLTEPARAAWWGYARQVEGQQAKGQPYEHITGWAGKAAEQAARIALVLTLFADPMATGVNLDAMQAGIALATWYCGEWARICDVVEPSPEQKQAVRAREGLQVTYGGKTAEDGKPETFTARDIYTAKIAGITTRAVAEAVLKTLAEHGEIETVDPPKPKKAGRPPLVRWRLR